MDWRFGDVGFCAVIAAGSLWQLVLGSVGDSRDSSHTMLGHKLRRKLTHTYLLLFSLRYRALLNRFAIRELLHRVVALLIPRTFVLRELERLRIIIVSNQPLSFGAAGRRLFRMATGSWAPAMLVQTEGG
jgi:hypothetical protein